MFISFYISTHDSISFRFYAQNYIFLFLLIPFSYNTSSPLFPLSPLFQGFSGLPFLPQIYSTSISLLKTVGVQENNQRANKIQWDKKKKATSLKQNKATQQEEKSPKIGQKSQRHTSSHCFKHQANWHNLVQTSTGLLLAASVLNLCETCCIV